MSESLESIADRLYAVPPSEFVGARDVAVATAKADGDKASAKAIGALRRPTVAAWMVNLLALRRPEQLDELLGLAERMRDAQANLAGSDLRDLTVRRRKAVTGLVNTAAGLAVEAGASRSGLPTADVEMTLTAALADSDVASDVRSGRLVKTAQYDGFGAMPRPDLQLITDGKDLRKDATSSGRRSKPAPDQEHRPGHEDRANHPDRDHRRRAPRGRGASEPAERKVNSAALARRQAAARRLRQADAAVVTAQAAVEAARQALSDAETARDLARKTLEAAESGLLE